MITWKTLVSYLVVIAFSILFLYFGNQIVSPVLIYEDDSSRSVEARVERIISISETDLDWGTTTIIKFEALVTSGEYRNEAVIARQTLDDFMGALNREVSEGDRVILVSFSPDEWYFFNFIRIHQIIILGGIFVALLLVLGKIKGLNAMLSLGFTCAAIFAVFIPSILSGKNIYLSAVIVCAYSIIVTILIINGVNKKSLAAITGCLGGVIAAALLTLIMNHTLELTGVVSSESIRLLYFNFENPIDLRAVIFAGIIIGAVGAVMDVAVSISSALWELKSQAPNLPLKKIYQSGIKIGKDVMASMTNTLVLAYIGSSLSVILLLVVDVGSLAVLFNSEFVIVEFLQAIIGSLGILATMPLTAFICAVLLSPKQKDTHSSDHIRKKLRETAADGDAQ